MVSVCVVGLGALHPVKHLTGSERDLLPSPTFLCGNTPATLG